jgi:RimJ/RimL family protein N-acetyltransferase
VPDDVFRDQPAINGDRVRRRAYENAGFTLEGRMRDALLAGGERVDAVLMSRLRTDLQDA